MADFAPPVDPDRALEVVEQALAACPADAVEVALLGRAGEYTRFAGERIHQPQDVTELTIAVKAVVDGHVARASTSAPSRVADVAAAAAATARARASVASAPGHGLVAGPAPSSDPPTWHDDTVAFDAGARVALAERAMRATAAARGSAAGMIGRAVTQLAVGTSSGVRRHALATEATGSFTATVQDGTAHWADLHRSAGALDTEVAIDAAVERAFRSRGRVPVPDGEHTVVLGPQAVAELLGFLDAIGFDGQLAAAGVGVVARHAGERVASELVTVADDAHADVGLPIGFDLEGVPKRTVPLLTAGVVGEPVTDLATAAALGTSSSGHAHIAREEAPAPVAANIVLAAGSSSEAELVAGVDRGIYVERFWYTRLVDRQAATITGVSRDACFLINGGRLGAPLQTGRFTQSLLDLLATVDGVGDRVHSLPVMNVWNGSVSAPAVRAHGFRFGPRPIEDGRR